MSEMMRKIECGQASKSYQRIKLQPTCFRMSSTFFFSLSASCSAFHTRSWLQMLAVCHVFLETVKNTSSKHPNRAFSRCAQMCFGYLRKANDMVPVFLTKRAKNVRSSNQSVQCPLRVLETADIEMVWVVCEGLRRIALRFWVWVCNKSVYLFLRLLNFKLQVGCSGLVLIETLKNYVLRTVRTATCKIN